MTRTQLAKLLAKNALLYLALLLALLVLVPLVAGLAWASRFVLPLLLIALLVVMVASPVARGWLKARIGGESSW